MGTNEYSRGAVMRELAPAVARAEKIVGGPVVVLMLDPEDPLVRQIMASTAAAYEATPAPLQASAVLVATKGAWSVYTVAGGAVVCEDSANHWHGMDQPSVDDEPVPPSLPMIFASSAVSDRADN